MVLNANGVKQEQEVFFCGLKKGKHSCLNVYSFNPASLQRANLPLEKGGEVCMLR